MLFRKLKEKQSLINASRKALVEADKKIKKLLNALEVSRHNNTVLLERNKKQAKILKEIKTLTEEQQYGSINNFQNKIKSILMTAKSI